MRYLYVSPNNLMFILIIFNFQNYLKFNEIQEFEFYKLKPTETLELIFYTTG